jgi:hypothetical protein
MESECLKDPKNTVANFNIRRKEEVLNGILRDMPHNA